MRSGILKRGIICLLSALVMVALAAGRAGAAEPTLYELPPATHASTLAVGSDGTAWWAPSRGFEYQGSKSMIGKVNPDGTVVELSVTGLGRIISTTLGTEGEIWLTGYGKSAKGEWITDIGRASPSGQLEKRYVVVHGWGSIGSLTVTPGAVWFVNHRPNGRESIERLSTSDGAVRQVVLGPNCVVEALAAAGRAIWFTEGCKRERGEVGVVRGSVNRIGPNGKIVRHPVPKEVEPISLAVGPEGTVWFGASDSNYRSWVGRITRAGRLAEYRLPKGSGSRLITVGGEGRLWFPTSAGGDAAGDLDSIGVGGRLGEPICADPTCQLAPTALTTAPDGSLWYALQTPHPLEGGGGSQIAWTMQIESEAGFIGHLVP